MPKNRICKDFDKKITLLEQEIAQRKRSEGINRVLFSIANAVNMTANLDELFQTIHNSLTPVIDTTNFYIALYDSSTDGIHFPYIVDSVDEYYPPRLEVSKTASLTAEVIRTGKPLMIQKKDILRQRQESGFIVPHCTVAEMWLGVPLKTRGDIVGVMAVQSYLDPNCYDQTSVNVMVAVADQVALAVVRKHTEEALKASEINFRRIVTTANEGIMSMDANWQITFINSHLEKMLGYESEELLGKSMEQLLRDEDLEDFLQKKQERLNGITNRFERRFLTKQGKDLWAIVSATPIFGENGEFAGSFGMVTDISSRKIAEKALQEKVKELSKALEQIKTLRGIVPICMHCKKIRDDSGFWNQVEAYVRRHTEAEFSHGICPDCMTTLYPEYNDNSQD